MKNALVTGGSGYIGSHLTHALKRAGWFVLSFDKRAPHPTRLVNSQVVGDLLSPSDVEYLTGHKFDVIFHLAALIDVEESQREPERYWANNTTATERLLEAFPKTPIVFSSTAAVYDSSNDPLSESHSLRPSSVYGETKLTAEVKIREAGNPHAILRYFNVAGCSPGMVDNHKRVTHLIPRALKSDGIEIYGDDYETSDGTAVRDYVHVEDVAMAHIAAAERLKAGKPSITANIGSGMGYSVQDVLACVRDVTGRELPSVTVPRRSGDPAALVADTRLAERELGFSPRYGLRDMISSHAFD